jgi:hypothetical protein
MLGKMLELSRFINISLAEQALTIPPEVEEDAKAK